MNNLFSHIEYLLLSNDCVIVPGLGAFIAITCPARIDSEKGLILPPSRRVMFNQAVSSDDGLLANSIVRKYHINFEEARQIILREISVLKSQLNSEKEILVGNLGTLQSGGEGNMVFTPAANYESANSQLGFCPLNLPKEEDNITDNSENTSIVEEPKRHLAGLFRLHKTFSKVAVAFSLLIAFVVAFMLYPIPVDDREQRASVIPVDAIMTPPVAEAAAETTPIPETSQPSEPTETVESEVVQPNHYLIVGTFKSNSEAMNYMATHSKDADMQIVESRKVTRVAIAASDDMAELKKLLNSKEIHDKYPHAWIWTRN